VKGNSWGGGGTDCGAMLGEGNGMTGWEAIFVLGDGCGSNH
jgi:hypothetical protein